MARVQRTFLFDTERDAEIIRRYEAGETAQMIADRLGASQDRILRELHRLGVNVRSNRESHTKHTLRHDAFDVLTPDAAYWCGFLFTDGSVSRRPGQTPDVSVALSECDRGHLEKLRAFLGSSHALTLMPARPATFQARTYTSRAACRFSVRSSQLAERLLALGRYDGPVNDGLAQSRDFWRGVIDGDGSIMVSGGLPSVAVVGSRRLLEAFVAFLGNTGARHLHVHPHKTIYGVRSSGTTAERIIDRLYTDAATALDRKAAKAADILTQATAREPRPAGKWNQGGGRFALINARYTVCAECAGNGTVVNGRVRLEHETGCAIGSRLAARLSA